MNGTRVQQMERPIGMEEKSGGKERFNISVLVVVFRLVLNEVLVTMTIAFKSFRKCL